MNQCGVTLSSVSRKGLLMTGLPQDVQKLHEFMKQQDDILIHTAELAQKLDDACL